MEMCQRCADGATGEEGHSHLRFYVGGPYPGQSIFSCDDCGERWIRHASPVERFGWTRYFAQYPALQRTPIATGKGGVPARGERSAARG